MNTTPPFDPVLTTEAARILAVSPETIRHWEQTGRLPAIKTERGVRLFNRCDVEYLARRLEERRSATPTPARPEALA